MQKNAQICKKYVFNMQGICIKYAYISTNMHKYVKICIIYAKNMQIICSNMQVICILYANICMNLNMHKICIKYETNMQKNMQKYTRNMQEICTNMLKYA